MSSQSGRLFSQSALLLLSYRSSLPVQICKKPKFLRSVGILYVSDNFIHNKNRFFSTIVLVYKFRYLGSQHTKAVLALLSVSVTFIHKEHRFDSAVALLYQFRYVKSRISRAGLAFWSVSHTFIHNKHHFDSTVVLLYKFRYLGNRHTIAVKRPGETGQHCLPNTIVCFCVISYGQSTHVAIWTRTMMFG